MNLIIRCPDAGRWPLHRCHLRFAMAEGPFPDNGCKDCMTYLGYMWCQIEEMTRKQTRSLAA